MGSTIERRPIAPPNDRRARNALVMVGVGVILLFAILGVVSAGIFVGQKISGSSSSPPSKHHTTTGSAVAAQDLARAHAQATQIVATAQQSGKALVKRQAVSAQRQAAAIVSAARRHAASITASAQSASSSATGAGTTSQQAAGTGSTGTSTTTGSSSTTGTSTSTGTSGSSSYGSTSPTTAYGSPPSATANLNALPATWLVVAYNPTFGSGPGSAGAITVTNRSSKRFSGTAEVVYTGGGTATAPFSGIAPGQTVVLPLNGPPYPGRGLSIRVVNPH